LVEAYGGGGDFKLLRDRAAKLGVPIDFLTEAIVTAGTVIEARWSDVEAWAARVEANGTVEPPVAPA
jgi:hypothetical protein